MNGTVANKEMPRYKCHKEVWALKIAEIVSRGDGGAELTIADEGFLGIVVSKEYVDKHAPVPGGYYIVYKDGYKSFSPAEAFEQGYTRI